MSPRLSSRSSPPPTAREKLVATGIRRSGAAGAFHYRTAEGGRPDAATLARIRALVIPPAWRGVHVSPRPHAILQAVGRDRAGRWQYLYHPAQVRRRERAKEQRLITFLDALPRLRKRVDDDLRLPGRPEARVMASIVRIMSTCFLRPGSRVYAHENGSFGIATLRRRHVRVTGSRIEFEFAGKGGKPQQHELTDPQCARIIRDLCSLPGFEVFKFEDAAGWLVDVRRRHINRYLCDISGVTLSAKDFRTWAGTLICTSLLGQEVPARSQTGRRRQVAAALRTTADLLGNTPAVCRSSYVHAAILARFQRGEPIGGKVPSLEAIRARDARALRRLERLVLSIVAGQGR